jgi:hypothetical protein
MVSRKTIASVSVAAALVLCGWALTSAQGQLPDQRTFFTFSAPVSLPGVTLQAGKYEFKLLNATDRHVVQVFNSDNKLVTTLFAIPSIRMDVPDNPEVRFMETPANMPPAIQTWWYPGNKTGHEFLYSKEQATALAKVNTRGVLAGGETGDITRINAAGEETKVAMNESKAEEVSGRAQAGERPAAAPAPSQPAPRPEPAAVTPEPPATPPQPAPVTRPETPRVETPAPSVRTSSADIDRKAADARTDLPHSASPLPIFLLIGFGSLGAGVLLRTPRTERA